MYMVGIEALIPTESHVILHLHLYMIQHEVLGIQTWNLEVLIFFFFGLECLERFWKVVICFLLWGMSPSNSPCTYVYKCPDS